MDKTGRNGLRIGDIELDDFEQKFNKDKLFSFISKFIF